MDGRGKKERWSMPTERFNRLPDKKKEAIRIDAAKEFARVLPKEYP